ncbi:MAG: cupin [Acidobacteria bacterium]|nr:cupin [Acidobacteriota bacterium]
MKKALIFLCLMAGTLMAQEAKVTPLLSKDLPDLPGKEGRMVIVDYSPGGSSAVHRQAPGDIHLVSKNASTTAPAKFVVFFVKDKGAPVSTPVN